MGSAHQDDIAIDTVFPKAFGAFVRVTVYEEPIQGESRAGRQLGHH